MGEKLVIGPFNQGLTTNREPFLIDNDSFPVLINAYQWRGRIKRKRGTSLLGRLTRYFISTSTSYSSSSTINLVDDAANILTGFSLQSSGNIVPGSVTINNVTVPQAYTDVLMDGTLSGGAGGTINYATGAITISGGGANSINATFIYYPGLAVMGLEDLVLDTTDNPKNISFDTTYSYQIQSASPYGIYDVSFYKNLASATYTNYVQKSTWTPTWWNGEDYRQFWTVNYQGALWATNGISSPFSIDNIGMQFKNITGVAVPTATTATLTIVNHGLVVGDFVFVNEVVGTVSSTINFQTGYVTTVVDPNNVTVTFPNATLSGVRTSGGIAQYLTNRSDTTKDCLRWYDGDPTNGNVTTPSFSFGKGWVNFAPPLSQTSFSISDKKPAQYYLVGCKMITTFKDRLLFIAPVIQASSGNPIYLPDTVIFSQNGTPYYTASFTSSPSSTSTTFNSILVPTNQTATPTAYWEDVTGYGGFISAGLQQNINTISSSQDVIVMGFDSIQSRFVYTGNDILPFNFYVINSEYGSTGTFSTINMDQGVLTRGSRGFILTSQTDCNRFDVQIPDQVFEMRILQNGDQRVCAQRDFINEWVYFTYPSNDVNYKFPNQSLQYNYRDNSWAVFYESYTTYGSFRKSSGLTWETLPFKSWYEWTDPWNSGETTLLQPEVIAGNQQGFILVRGSGTGEGNSLSITSFSGNVVTAPNHCLRAGDYIVISGCIGTISTSVNGNIFSVRQIDNDTFGLNPEIGSGTYFGGGVIQRMYVPFIQSKQFPSSWGISRKTRIGVQQYLLSTTENSQIQLLIFLSQNASDPYNDGPVIPEVNSQNDGLIYSTTLYTCPESTNLGLTPANVNLQMPTARQQQQIWHRINTSLLGDTIQIALTMSDAQMRDVDFKNQFSEIEFHGAIFDLSPSMLLS